jgi:Sulfatase
VIALIMRTHFELLTQLQIGLTPQLLQMAPRMFGAGDFFRMMRLSDVLFLTSAPAIFFLALACAGLVRRTYKPVAAILIGVVLALQLLPTHVVPEWRIIHHPVVYLLDNIVQAEKDAVINGDFYGGRHDLPGRAQMNSIRLIDPVFVNTNNNSTPPPSLSGIAPDGKRWNILIFILESTGADYVFDDSSNQPMPMPFLKKICGEGLYLSNHFASANISARAGFSIFTGLYPPTLYGSTCMEANLMIPTLNRYLGPGYDYFFIHPTEPTYFFPEFLFLNNGLKELDSMVNMPAGIHPDLTEEARNAIDSFDFLQSRLDRAHEPFLAAYWSFIPHYPYSDYGPDYRIRPDVTKNRDRYYNDLRLLDDEIRRIWNHLEETGVADHTIFVVLGDHGEAFGQHGEWGHGLGYYDEMYRVPVVFWQPNLIQPQVIKFPTSHPDVLPTLLDLLGVRYDPSRFQGYSVLRGAPNRKYIFTMDGYADYVSAITPDMKKVTLSFIGNDSTAFNLAADPAEKFPLNRFNYPDEIEAIIKFRNYQSEMLPDYNRALLAGKKYPPKSATTVAKNQSATQSVN